MWYDEDGNARGGSRLLVVGTLLSSGRTVLWTLQGDEVARLGFQFLGDFFARRRATTGAEVCFRLSGVIMGQYTEAFGRISGLHARVVRT